MIVIELDDEDRPRIAVDEIAQPGGVGVQLRAIENASIHDLDRRWLMRQDARRGRERIEQVRELHDQQRFRPGQFDEPQLCFEDDAERAFGADEEGVSRG